MVIKVEHCVMLETPNGSLYPRCHLLLFTTDEQDREVMPIVQTFYCIHQAGNWRRIGEAELHVVLPRNRQMASLTS